MNNGTSGVLPYQEILELCTSQNLVSPTQDEAFQAASYDLTVGSMIKGGKTYREADLSSNESLVQPGEVVTFLTAEEINLPSNLAAFVSAINSQSEEGILVLNPGHIDPGYKGTISVKAINLRKTAFRINPGMRIFTIVFHRLAAPTTKPYARPAESRTKREAVLSQRVLDSSMPSLTELLTNPNNTPFTLKRELEDRLRDSGFVKSAAVTEQIQREIDRAPFLKPADVDGYINRNWQSRVSMWTVIVGTCLAIIALFYTITTTQTSFAQTLTAIRGLPDQPAQDKAQKEPNPPSLQPNATSSGKPLDKPAGKAK